MSYNGYMEYMLHKNAPPPLTVAEEEIKLLNETEVRFIEWLNFQDCARLL